MRCKTKSVTIVLSGHVRGPGREIANCSPIPSCAQVEVDLPVEELFELAVREGNSKKPIYELHKWWARRLGHVFRFLLIAATTPARKDRGTPSRLIDRFYSRNNLSQITILDPFMGGGTSVVEALKCGARVIGVDVDPMAWFITKKEVEPFDRIAVERALATVSEKLETELRSLYQIPGPEGTTLETVNVFWVNRIRCGSCRRKFDAHPHYRLSYTVRDRRQVVFCRACGTVHDIGLRYRRFSCTAALLQKSLLVPSISANINARTAVIKRQSTRASRTAARLPSVCLLSNTPSTASAAPLESQSEDLELRQLPIAGLMGGRGAFCGRLAQNCGIRIQ